jgi:site-specific DNA-methyltransferase (adenine-specific)
MTISTKKIVNNMPSQQFIEADSRKNKTVSMINSIVLGDCREVMKQLPDNSISCCVTDPPYNYEFIGHKWNHEEIERRLNKVKKGTSTLVKNIPYGSGLAGGVRNTNWYKKNRNNILDYQNWCREWGEELYRICKPGALISIFNSTRTCAHIQVALEDCGFYARDILVWRRSSGIPKGLNLKGKLEKMGISHTEDVEGWHSCLRSEWEAVVVVQKPLENNYIETLNKYGVGLFHAENAESRFQSNILEGFSNKKNDIFKQVHCTVKPLDLIEKLLKMTVPLKKENTVIDPFSGSGTTILAAKKLGLQYIGIEIEKRYVEFSKTLITTW